MVCRNRLSNRLMLGNSGADLVGLYRQQRQASDGELIPSLERYLRQLDGLVAVYRASRCPPRLRQLLADWSYRGVANHVGWNALRKLQSPPPYHDLTP